MFQHSHIDSGRWGLAALLAAALTACGSGGDAGTLAQGQPAAAGGAQQSTNWAGYVQSAAPLTYTKVSGSWIVPAVSCAAGQNTGSTNWTGIGGGISADPTLIQAGTDEDCTSGTAQYFAWWEAIPAPSVNAGPLGGLLSSMPVAPGDMITVTIDGSSLAVWNIAIQNVTQGASFSTTVPYVAAGETAEWIEEASLAVGAGGAGQVTLGDFGRVPFFGLKVNGANPALTAAQRTVLVDSSGGTIANTSGPGPGDDSFDVCFGGGVCR